VGALKHDAHDFDIDRPGKDSARFTAAGAEVTVIASDAKVAMVKVTAEPAELDFLLRKWFDGMDVVLVEGYKTSDLPKLEVHRPELGQPLLTRGERYDDALLAVASTGPLEVDVPVLDADDPAAVADFIEQEVLRTGD
jgi:molybdopterin-guanine dinucleotide biosynthesis protein MobB